MRLSSVAAFWRVDAWLFRLRRFWSVHIDALERYLDRMDRSTRTNEETERR